MVEIQGK